MSEFLLENCLLCGFEWCSAECDSEHCRAMTPEMTNRYSNHAAVEAVCEKKQLHTRYGNPASAATDPHKLCQLSDYIADDGIRAIIELRRNLFS